MQPRVFHCPEICAGAVWRHRRAGTVQCSMGVGETAPTLHKFAGPPKGQSVGFGAPSILKYMGRSEPVSAIVWESMQLAMMGTAVLKHVLTFVALPATSLGRADVALRDLLLVRVHRV